MISQLYTVIKTPLEASTKHCVAYKSYTIYDFPVTAQWVSTFISRKVPMSHKCYHRIVSYMPNIKPPLSIVDVLKFRHSLYRLYLPSGQGVNLHGQEFPLFAFYSVIQQTTTIETPPEGVIINISIGTDQQKQRDLFYMSTHPSNECLS